MTTNGVVLIAVVMVAARVLAATMAAVTYKTRTLGRDVEGYAVRDRAEASALRELHREAVANDDRRRPMPRRPKSTSESPGASRAVTLAGSLPRGVLEGHQIPDVAEASIDGIRFTLGAPSEGTWCCSE